ncbi:MAG TPA: pirin family protein [Mycobacteriales bacterium]|nr:pirin family protein [Mycobacteriales bacterium]
MTVHRGADRFRTVRGGVESRHSFSFGRHYDGANTSYGVLVAHNEDVLQAGDGYRSHPHRDLEILTWVLEGALLHEDSTGGSALVTPGQVQRLSAGSGVVHSERHHDLGGAVGARLHLVQMWVLPDRTGTTPRYDRVDVGPALAGGALVPVASGRAAHAGATPVRIASAGAALHVARLQPGRPVLLPEAPYLHLFVARGTVNLEGAGPLTAGDAARLTSGGGQRIAATGPAEVLLWEMHTAPGPPTS